MKKIDELKVRSTDRLNLYGAYLNNPANSDDPLDQGGCQDFSDGIKLEGVLIVNKEWLIETINDFDKLIELMENNDG